MAAQRKTPPRMAEEDKRFIYEALKRNFSFDEEYPLANLGWCFLREGIDKADYGFIKLKPMLEEMSDFVDTSTKEVGGVSQSMFTLHEHNDFEKAPASKRTSKQKKESKDLKETNNGKDSKNLKDTNSEEEPKSRRKASSQKKRPEGAEVGRPSGAETADSGATSESAANDASEWDAAAVAQTEGAASSSGIPADAGRRGETAEESAASSPARSGRSARQKAASKTKAQSDAEANGESVSEGRQKSGDAKNTAQEKNEEAPKRAAKGKPRTKAEPAAEEAPSPKPESAVEPVSDPAPKSRRAAVANRRAASKPAAAPGAASNGASASASNTAPEPSSTPASGLQRPSRGRAVPGKALERFADLGSWPDFLSDLASLALEEPWDFCEVPGIDASGMSSKRYDILHNYIRYTFYRLSLEDKVAFSDDERFAAFNTGLVDKHYEDIYACFEPAAADGRQRWAFVGFCTAGTGRFGKRLVREMSPLPQPASYLQRKEDLLFDLDREVVCDIRHIVVDNVHRLPLNFLRDELASSAECRGILAGVEDLTERGRAARFDRLRSVIADDPRLFTRLSNSINAAIEQARRQVRWNYKTAVPAYYPRTNSMNLLLPLNLTEATTPDVALVVELQKSGNYQGQTIVTMAQAYRDARLLCRPYIDWLSPASIIDAASDEDEDE